MNTGFLNKSDFKNETERIEIEYLRRSHEIPGDFYSLFNLVNFYFYSHRALKVISLLHKFGIKSLGEKKILEIGCGAGQWLVDLESFGALQSNLFGIELLEKRALQAQARLPRAEIKMGNAAHLPWQDASFDLVLQSTVFTSVLQWEMRQQIAKEMLRVLRPGGVIIWYDFRYNNPKNNQVKGIRRKEIQRLFPDCIIKLQSITLAPPIARKLASKSFLVCYLLEKIPFLRTHYLGIIKKINNNS